MNLTALLLSTLLLISTMNLQATAQANQSKGDSQNNQLPWKNKQAAVVLTYDDGLNVDLTNAIPALDKVGLKGTFYIADFGNLRKQIPGWKIAASKGHELANHTVYHPCTGGTAGREFVTPAHDLRYYSIARITDEMK